MKLEANIKKQVVLDLFIDGMPTQKLWGGTHCRQVFKVGQYYIKFDNPRYEWDTPDIGNQTRMELEFISEIDLEDRKFFNIPVAYGKLKGLYYTIQLAQTRVRNLTTAQDEKDFYHIKRKYKLKDVELPNSNCFLTEDSFKIYDYAPIRRNYKFKRGLHTIKKSLKIENPQLFLPTKEQGILF